MYMRNHTSGFVSAALAQALKKDDKWQEAKAEEAVAIRQLQAFKVAISPRMKTGQTFIQMIEATSGDD
jgi:hypothetical protein